MTPEETDSFKKGQRSENASMEKPVHERGQPPPTVKASSPNTIAHQEIFKVRALPITPSLNLYTINHVTITCSRRAAKFTQAITAFFSWLCKNL